MLTVSPPVKAAARSRKSPWEAFRVDHPHERVALLREMRDHGTPLSLHGPAGATIAAVIWALDIELGRLSLSAEGPPARLDAFVEADEATAIAYLDAVKVQFDLQGLTLVRGTQASAVQAAFPHEIYRFQRRGAFRVRMQDRRVPMVHLRHPTIRDTQVSLRALNISIGGCALWLPGDAPAVAAGSQFSSAVVALDAQTQVKVALTVRHVCAMAPQARGARLGCEWTLADIDDRRALQRWIDHAQKRQRLIGTS